MILSSINENQFRQSLKVFEKSLNFTTQLRWEPGSCISAVFTVLSWITCSGEETSSGGVSVGTAYLWESPCGGLGNRGNTKTIAELRWSDPVL